MSESLEVPVVVGSEVTLRPHRIEDLDAVYERCVDPDTRAWTTIPLDYSREMAEDYLRGLLEPSAEQVSWAIEVGGAYAGTIDLRSYGCLAGHGAGDVGYVTHPSARGRGVMSEALGLAVGHAFDTLGWELVQWKANLGNVASYKAAWRNGFRDPLLVPALLNHRGVMKDAWISTLRAGEERGPRDPWEEALAALPRG